jgi:hypothetical protein
MTKKGVDGASDTLVDIDETGIAWATDKEFKFKNVQEYKRGDATTPTKGAEVWKDV